MQIVPEKHGKCILSIRLPYNGSLCASGVCTRLLSDHPRSGEGHKILRFHVFLCLIFAGLSLKQFYEAQIKL